MKIPKQNQSLKFKGNASGFTIVELLVAIVVMTVAMGAIYAVFTSVVRSYTIQRELAHMQQNMRAAMYLIKNDLRNAARNPMMDDSLGITDVGRYNPDADDPFGYPGITMTTRIDTDNDGAADDVRREIIYRVFDTDGDGRRELRRQVNSGNWDLVFDGVEDIGFAFAYDNDNDLDLDRSNIVGVGAGTVIWAIHTDNVAGLDTNLDNNPDGNIDILDDGDNDGDIDPVDGGLGTQIPLADIRAVRIWLLARSRQPIPNYRDGATYTVGRKVIDMSALAPDDNRNTFRHKLLVGAVALPNHERKP